MAKGFDTLHVKSALQARNKISLDFDHLTTFNFGQVVPLGKIKTIPGDKFNVKGDYFSRLAPLVKPTYGKFSFRVLNGYVPIHMIAYDGEAWINGNTSFEGMTPVGRFFTLAEFCYFITNFCTTSSGANATNSDFTFVDGAGNVNYSRFTTIGKYYVKVLTALGYSLPEGVDRQSTSSWTTNLASKKLSAFPLLAFAKLYNDYMSQSQRFNTSALSNFLRAVKYRESVTGFTGTNGFISSVGINTILSSIVLQYDNDYFTSAWQTPNNPINSVQHINSLQVPGADGVLSSNSYNTVLTEPVDPVPTPNVVKLTERAQDMLRRFDAWVRRNNYSGSRSVQQMYSRFGIKSDDYRSHYAHILSKDILPVQVGDVTALGPQYIGAGNVNNVGLGDYSGKGIMSGSKGFSCECSDYGYILSLGWFTVVPMNPYGFDRDTLTVEPLDFYTPEFDGIGADAISYMEIFEDSTQNPSTDSTSGTDVFGFTERYNSYRFGRDLITGDFRSTRANSDMNVWHLGRNLAGLRQGSSLVAQGVFMNSLTPTSSEYNRIFSNTSDDIDHFYLTAHYEVDAVRPMKNLNQVVDLGEGGVDVPRNGNVVS